MVGFDIVLLPKAPFSFAEDMVLAPRARSSSLLGRALSPLPPVLLGGLAIPDGGCCTSPLRKS
jgi:hypothetical protein